MASIDRTDVDAAIEALRLAANDDFDVSLEKQIQTDKDRVKLVPCRECRRPLVVTTFFAPAKAVCSACTGDDAASRVASVGQPIPGHTDPAKAVNLADCLINPQFAHALCPVHPDDEEHVMELKSITHNDNYGPGEWVQGKGGAEYRQTAKGECVTHQCKKCLAVVDYRTTVRAEYRRQNEPKIAPNLGAPERHSLLGFKTEVPPAVAA